MMKVYDTYEHSNGQNVIFRRVKEKKTGRIIKSERLTFATAAEAAKQFEKLMRSYGTL